jgi:hypothetical protein
MEHRGGDTRLHKKLVATTKACSGTMGILAITDLVFLGIGGVLSAFLVLVAICAVTLIDIVEDDLEEATKNESVSGDGK